MSKVLDNTHLNNGRTQRPTGNAIANLAADIISFARGIFVCQSVTAFSLQTLPFHNLPVTL